jgi:alkanesulfonate monooxygenase
LRGRQFAATHAECVFINGPSKQVIAPIVADIRKRGAAAGRNPAEILIFTMMTVVTAATSEAARGKLEERLIPLRPGPQNVVTDGASSC